MDEDDIRPPSEEINDYDGDGDEYYDDEDPPPPDEEMDEEDEIEEMYGFVLDSLLFPPHVKEQLMQTQTKEKKLMIINMHKHLLQNKKGAVWGDQQNSLLNLISKSKRPDIQVLITLRSSLATGNKDFLTGFLEADGVYVLMKCIDERIAKLPMTDLDASILYEVIFCCKCIMNNDTGMEALLVTPGAIEHIAKSLFFEWKPIALTVLEILAVCCYYSESSSAKVVSGMKLLSKMRNEAPFQCLCQALINEDVEVKAAVAVFVNSMIMGMDNVGDRNYLRAELTTQLYSETYEDMLGLIRDDMEKVDYSSDAHENIVVESMVARRKFYPAIMPGSGSSDQQSSNQDALTGTSGGSDLTGYIQAGKGKHTIAVNPSNGTMAGVCITVTKDTRKFSIAMPLMTKEKMKVNTIWYELDGTSLKCCDGKEREPKEMKVVIPMANVVFIRDYTTDSKLSKEVRFTLEIETTDDVIALGCETAFDKDNWMTALTVARDLAVMKRSAYRLVSKDLTIDEFKAHADMYIKQGTIYYSMLADDRELVITSYNLDTSDPLMISEFLYHEMVAMGQSDQYHELLQLLLLLPPGTPKLWKFLNKGVRRLVSCSISDDEEMDDSFKIDMNSLVAMLENKADELGAIYPQVSKLAMSVMTKETELRHMKSEVNHSMVLLERVKTDMTESLQSVDQELQRRGGRYEEIRQMLLPIMDIPDRHLASGTDEAEDEEAMAGHIKNGRIPTRRRASSVADIRYEMYNRMLKSLPDSVVVKEKMILDGFSETEISDFFGVEVSALPTGTGSGGVSGGGGGGGGLSTEKYKKMLKLLPASVVREKMLETGFPDKEIDEMIGPYDPTAPVATVTSGAGAPVQAKPMDPKYEKYFKMMKMLPEGAVRQKMATEGLSEGDIEEFFKQLVDVAVATASGATIAATAPAPPPIDPKYEKFIKMSKMLPDGPVRQKMMADGMSEADIDHYFNKVLPDSKNPGAASAAAPAPATDAPAPAAANEKYEKYTKMLKMLPEGAVRQKMTSDGIPEGEINSFFGAGSSPVKAGAAVVGAALTGLLAGAKKGAVAEPEKPPAGMKIKDVVTPAKKMKGLFWTKLKNADVPGTLWEEIEEFAFPEKSKNMIDTLFSAVISKAGDDKNNLDGGLGGTGGDDKLDTARNAAAEKKKAAGVSLFDGKRVQGVLIFLGRVRKSPKEVVNIIIKLDAKIMNLVLTETILNICPTTEELTTVKSFDKGPETLDLTGQLFYELSTIPRLELRLRCHEITFKWDSDASEASTHVGVFLKACMELRRTKQLIGKLLSMVLTLGNYLNGGTPRGQAYGVKLDFMAKLSTVKMNPIAKVEGTNTPSILCGPTVLHFLALQADQIVPEMLEISSTWENVWIASEISFAQMENDIKQLDLQLQKIRDELKIGVPIIKEESGEAASEPLKERLTGFLLKAEGRMQNIQTHLTETTATLKTTMALFGEGNNPAEGDDTVSTFFTTLSSFIKAFNQSIEDNRKLKEDEEKKLRKVQEANRMKEHRAARATLASGGSANVPTSEVTSSDGSGIFSDFKKAQTMKADEIINNKREQRLRHGGPSRPTSKLVNSGAKDGEASPAVGGERRRRRPSLVREKAVGSSSSTTCPPGSGTTSALGAKSRLA